MLIIKPYGRSHTEFDDGKTPKRKIRRNPTSCVPQDTLVDVKEFAETHPELIIAQWISAIDKIATKPRSGRNPTPEQRRFRGKIGQAAFDLMIQKKFLDVSGKEKEKLKQLWWSKIHPYGNDAGGSDPAKSDSTAGENTARRKSADTRNPGREKGRWYETFAGDTEPSKADAGAIAEKICQHLYKREYRIRRGSEHKRQGRIKARAESIAKNVLALQTQLPDKKHSWAEQEKAYEKAGDVATEIRQKALEKEKEGKGDKFSVRDVAPILFAQYGRLFKNGNGKPLPIADACKKFPGLFELHDAVKGTYTRILKNHRTLKNKKKSVVHVLPVSMESLFRLVEAKSDNRDLNALVRLGKITHYEATPSSGEDDPGNIPDNWPKDVERSQYRTSEGQAEIKRTEAFVRVWRNTIALAARTLTDWADPDGKIGGDILSKVEKATGERFDATAYGQKLPFLFGKQASLFEREDDAFKKSVLRLALNGWAELRHSSFHFKGRGGFVKALKESLASAEDNDAVGVACDLLKQDLQGQRDRLIDLLRAAHVEHYFDQKKLDVIVHAVVNVDLPQSPLPRFRRVLDRAKNAWNRKPYILHLPPPDNRAELEKPARQCRYVTVKTLYERPFPAWLEKQSAETLNEWINHAVERTTKMARSINNDELAVAKAAGLIHLNQREGIANFLDRLSAATSTELRVQRGYDSDADNARNQAKYLDDLRCDVVGQAFEAYLKKAELSWVLDELGDGPLPEKKRSNLPQPASETAPNMPEPWEAVLYFLLHLVPVDAVGRLQHQLRKWSILEKKVAAAVKGQQPVADSAGRMFVLYLDMHDAKFEGGEGMIGAKELKSLFESEQVFSRACPSQQGQDTDRYVPWRGLREIRRFGCLKPLMPIFQEHHIGAGEVDELTDWETVSDGDSRIAERQKKREELHDKWVKNKNKKLSVENKKAYCKALADVVRHRHLAAHVRLNNHARLHSLLMGVLGRLVDYAGLWERDLYFTTLALVWLGQKSPGDVFQDKGLEFLKNGQIVWALKHLEKSGDDGTAIVKQLKRLFGEDFLNGKGSVVSIRNNLMHFKMLQGGEPVLNLTETVNDTRRLMAYDRKLKNAVSQSIKEMLAREGFDLTWEMRGHRLECAKIKVRHAIHLKDGRIKENLHGDQFVKMAASLFCGEQEPSDDDVLSVDLDKIKWDRQPGQNPKGGWKTHRNRSENRGNKGSFSPRKR